MSKFSAQQLHGIREAAAAAGVRANALLAFIDVESAGIVTVNVEGRRVPLIRWEGHYFDRLVPASLRAAARRQGLASPKAGRIKNPRSQTARYAMLARGRKLSVNAAISSCSWGIGQVMGDHWKWLGFRSAKDFERVVMSGFSGQLEVMVRFIQKSGIVDHLNRLDWSGAARIYNGPAYAKNKYHIKLRDRYRFYNRGIESAAPTSSGMLRAGSRGAAVRNLQQLLTRAGLPATADGDFGPATERAVIKWQTGAGIDVDGVVGPETMKSLAEFAGAQESAGEVPIKDVEEVRTATKTAAPVALVVALKDEIAGLATQLTGIESALAGTIGTYLMSGAGLIGVGLAAYAVYGTIKSRTTELGIEEVA